MSSRFEHDALLYESDAGFVRAIAPFIRDGLERGEGAVATATPAQTADLRDELGADAAQVVFVDAADYYGRPVAALSAFKQLIDQLAGDGYPRARVACDVSPELTERAPETWMRVESAANAAFAGQSAWVVCAYDIRRHSERVLMDACRTHPALWSQGRELNDRYVFPERLLAEVPEPMPPVGGLLLGEQAITEDLDPIRTMIRQCAAGAALSPTETDDLTLAATEVAANAIRHGAGDLCFRAWSSTGQVVCEVVDHGPGIADPLAGYIPPPDASVGGMGLWVARQSCDGLGIRSGPGGTVVRLAQGRDAML